jgi:nephrocystin-3
MKNFQNREVRIFISSTFRGMNNDRKALVDHVFPEISRRCKERGIGFTYVDLRWGITSEEVDQGLATPICFQQIDNCQPFFVGLLGEYYGSTILPEQIKAACKAYPWIAQGYLNRSITELEILYSIFNVGQNHSDDQHQALVENALFYFRDPNSADTVAETDSEKRAKQANLKQRLHHKGCHIEVYNQADDLKNLVIEPLWEKINNRFPDNLTEQQKINFEHDAFANSRQRVYIKRQADFDRLKQHLKNYQKPLIIHGESGSGKTALLANWAAEYQEDHPDELVFWHFCGSSPDSTDPIDLLRRIMLNLKIHFNMEEELPSTEEAIMDQFGQWLAKATQPVILVIDGFNQLQDTAITRGWWHSIPAKTRVLLSTISADNLPPDWQRFNLPLLTEQSARKALITEYLKQYGKSLADKPMQELLAHPQTANPLYLQVILDELRVFGEFDKLEQHLEGYLQTETIPDLYDKVLARLEEDYQPKDYPNLVADCLSLLWAARQGLNEAELLDILNIPQAVWSPLYLALQNALVSRGGLLSFFHDYLKQAVEKRYLSSGEKQDWHLRLADYFDNQELDNRVANELPWQLQQAGEKKRLRSCISDIPMFLQFKDDKEYELWAYWVSFGTRDEMVAAYLSGLDNYEKIVEQDKFSYALNKLGYFFDTVGSFFAAETLYKKALEIRENILGSDHPDTAISLNNLASLLYNKGDYSAAEPLYQRALDIRKKVLGAEHPDTASSLNNLAFLLDKKGEYSTAELLFRKALTIREKVLGIEHSDTAASWNNLALFFSNKANYSEAELLFRKALSIREKLLGVEHPKTAASRNNLAFVLEKKGNYLAAESLFRDVLNIREKVLGAEHPKTAISRNNLAFLLEKKGDYLAAESLFRDTLTICEKLLGSEHPETMISRNNLAFLLEKKRDYSDAESLFRDALNICEKVLGAEHPDTMVSRNNLAFLLEKQGNYLEAESLFYDALIISEKLLGVKHPKTIKLRNNLKICRRKINRE